MSGAGTVQYIDLEGGFYGIVADDGTQYLPLNLPAEFSEDGLAIEFTGYLREDIATIQQWGTPLEITHINLNDDTIEGIRHKSEPMFAVQYHPEAGPGPRDPYYLFERFRQLIQES